MDDDQDGEQGRLKVDSAKVSRSEGHAAHREWMDMEAEGAGHVEIEQW